MTATILQFEPRPAAVDGGKARIQARRAKIFPYGDPMLAPRWYRIWMGLEDDLTMDHADPCDIPSDSAYPSPQG